MGIRQIINEQTDSKPRDNYGRIYPARRHGGGRRMRSRLFPGGHGKNGWRGRQTARLDAATKPFARYEMKEKKEEEAT